MSNSAVTGLVALGFLTMGGVAMVRPRQIVGFFGVRELNADFRNEIRAVYGGFGVGTAALLLYSLIAPERGPAIQFTVAVSLLAMVGGRAIAWLVEPGGKWPVIFALIEVVAGGALLAGAVR